jgi:hypothetical protein
MRSGDKLELPAPFGNIPERDRSGARNRAGSRYMIIQQQARRPPDRFFRELAIRQQGDSVLTRDFEVRRLKQEPYRKSGAKVCVTPNRSTISGSGNSSACSHATRLAIRFLRVTPETLKPALLLNLLG